MDSIKITNPAGSTVHNAYSRIRGTAPDDEPATPSEKFSPSGIKTDKNDRPAGILAAISGKKQEKCFSVKGRSCSPARQ